MAKCWLHHQVVFSLDKLQRDMCNIMLFFAKKTILYTWWDELAKTTPHCLHHWKAKNQNNFLIVGAILPGAKKNNHYSQCCCACESAKFQVWQRRTLNASQHSNGVVCCSQTTEHMQKQNKKRNQVDRKSVPSLLPNHPAFSQRKVCACLCKKNEPVKWFT